MADETVKVKFLNANAEGWATEHDVEKGTLAETFVKQHVGPHYNPDGLKIAVNFKPAVREQVLQDGDFVSATWKNQDGGKRRRGYDRYIDPRQYWVGGELS